MILGGHIVIDKAGHPVRGFNSRISVYEEPADAERSATWWNSGGNLYTPGPATVAPVELRILPAAGEEEKGPDKP